MSTADMNDDIHMLAGEYVLGLMGEAERAAFEQRLATDPLARAALATSRERFLEIDTSAAPVSPSPQLWARIEGGLATASATAQSNVIDLTSRRREGTAMDSASPRSLPTRRSFWQGFAAASVLAMFGGGIAGYQLSLRKPRLVVVLLDAQAQPVSIVETYEGQRIRVVPLGTIDVPQGKTLQVWTLPDKQTGPVSMGLLETSTARVLEGPSLPPPQPNQLYEITIEQAGGSPTGKPTGPIVGKGFAKLPQI